MLSRELTRFLDEIGETVGGVGYGARVMPRHMLDVAGLFDRCRSMFGAVRLLLKGDFAHEAVFLTRPLFTDSLVLMEIAGSDETRQVERVVGWWLDAIADLEGIFLEEESITGAKPVEALAKVGERRRILREYSEQRGARSRRWRPAEKTLAKTHGRLDEYLSFRTTHHFVHGSSFAVTQRYLGGEAPEDTVAVGGKHAALAEWAAPAGRFAAYSLLHATRASCTILGMDEPDELDQLFERVKQEHERGDGGTA